MASILSLFSTGVDIVRNGLVGNWDAGSLASYPGSGTVWRDLSGRNNNLTISGSGVTFSTSFNGILTFNGSGSSTITSSSDFALSSGDYTIECWFRNTTTTSQYATMISIDNGTSFFQTIRFGDSGFGNKLQVAANQSLVSTVWSTAITKTSSLNIWYHAVLSRTSGTNTFWLNNTLQNINSGANPSTYPVTSFSDSSGSATATGLKMGGGAGGAGGVIGDISVCRVYNKGLTSDEIRHNFNALRGRYNI